MKITDRRPLPRTGLALPVFGLGCAQVGGLFQPMSEQDAAALFDSAWELGVRLFDTAPYYGYTRSEWRTGRPNLRPIARNTSSGTSMPQAFSSPWKPGAEFASQIR